MNSDNLYIVQEKIDELIKKNARFALYKLPDDSMCHFVLQTTYKSFKYNKIKEIKGDTGFIIAPFATNKNTPIVIIKPDVQKIGWDEISAFLATNSIPSEPTLKPTFSTISSNQNSYLYEFKNFITSIQSNIFKKLVLARSFNQPTPPHFSAGNTFIKALEQYPRAMTYICHTPETGTWMGSTPEILLSGTPEVYHTVALAGTKRNEEGINGWDDKNKNEQYIVHEYIINAIKHYGKIILKSEPCTIKAGHLIHIRTDIYFKLHSRFSIGDMLNALHPTPAVCGFPKKEALEFILKNEQSNRNYFSGFIGWYDPQNLSELYVNLRCMNILDDHVILYAGGGILKSSTALSEWDETEEKMKIMKKLL